jgi:hypothetical protein
MCYKKEKGRGPRGEETTEAELCRAPYASKMVALPIPVVVCREELSK